MYLFLLITALLFAFPASAAQDICKRIANNYIGGADVEHTGDHAAPAELNAIQNPVLAPVLIPVTLDLAQRYNLNALQGIELKPDVAYLEIHPDGRTLYNGQDISGYMSTACGKKPDINTQVNGQVGADVLKSTPKLFEVRCGIQGEILDGEYHE